MNDWTEETQRVLAQVSRIILETPEEKAEREICEHAEATKGLWALEDKLRSELGVEYDEYEYD